MSENDDEKQELRLPWDLNAGEKMQHDMDRLNIVQFFDNLDNGDKPLNFPIFQKNWNAIEDYEFTAGELTTILTRTVAVLDKLDDQELKKNCHSEMYFRFNLWEEQAAKKIPEFAQHDLALCLWGYRSLSLNPSDEFLDQWYQYANPMDILRAPKDEHKFVRSIVSSAVAGLKPSASFMAAWQPKAIKHMPGFTPTQLAFSLWAYARLNIKPEPEFMEAWKNRFNTLIDQQPSAFRQREIANIMGACGTLNVTKGDDQFKTIAAKASTFVDYKKCTNPEIRQILLARLWFDWPNDRPLIPTTERSSFLERDIQNAFNRAGLQSHKSYIEELRHKPDIAFNIDGQEILVEVDGDHHFLYEINEITGTKQAAGFTGRTLFMSSLIKKYAENAVLLRLPHPLIRQILGQNRENEKTILTDLLNTASKTDPGAYHTRMRRSTGDAGKLSETPIILRPLKITDQTLG